MHTRQSQKVPGNAYIGASARDLDGIFCDAIRVDKMYDWTRLHGLDW